METLVQLSPLIILFIVFYFFMVRPQKKKDKQIQYMRRGIQVGDEVVTIGGICGKVVKTKDESFIIQVGADKVKFEMMRWAVSTVTKQSARREAVEEVVEEPTKKALPKRLKKTTEVEEAEAAEAVENVAETAAEE